MISKRLDHILKDREFAYIATINSKGEPNAAPKFLLKKEEHFLYLIDHVMGMTYKNLKITTRGDLKIAEALL